MNRVRPRGLAALTAVCVLAVILLGTGCGSSVPGASSSPDRTSTGQPGEAPTAASADAPRCWAHTRPPLRNTRASVPGSHTHRGRTSAPLACPMSI